MIVREPDGRYVATHITGPTHNFLALRIDRGDPEAMFPVTVLQRQGNCCHHEGLRPEDVLPSIRDGLAQANAELGTRFRILSAEIVENDSRYSAAYQIMTRKIIHAAAAESD